MSEFFEAKFSIVRLAWRNILRNWRHSLATVLVIGAGFTSVSLFDGYLRDVEFQGDDGYETRGMTGDVIVEHKGAREKLTEDQWGYSLTSEEQAFLDSYLTKDPAFVRRVRFLTFSGLVSNGRNSTVFIANGYDVVDGVAQRGSRWEWNTIAGIPLHKSTQPSILVGNGLSQLLECSRDTTLNHLNPDGSYIPANRPFTCYRPRVQMTVTTESSQVNAFDLPIAGIVEGGLREIDNRWIVMSLEQAQRLLDTQKITRMSVVLKNKGEVADFIKRLNAAARESGFDFDAVPWLEHPIGATVRGGKQILHTFRNLFMAIVVTIGAMAVANTMMKAVSERTREIGTLRSLGFFASEINFMFACEGLFLAAFACFAGLVVTLILSFVISHAGITYRAGLFSEAIPLRVDLVPGAWLTSFVVLTLLSLMTSWLAARRASRMVIADAMRYVS